MTGLSAPQYYYYSIGGCFWGTPKNADLFYYSQYSGYYTRKKLFEVCMGKRRFIKEDVAYCTANRLAGERQLKVSGSEESTHYDVLRT